jgi:peptidoglycan/LPS O-acetylase OafA/YrhL
MATVAPSRAPSVEPGDTVDRAQISRVPYLPGLDGLRAIAVVAVMMYHANNAWLPGGFLGVEMFFVISGYLITLLLIAERERTYRISLGQFWLRRARRLLPAVFVMMLLVTVWTALFERDALGQLRGDVVAGTFYVSNWYQIWVGLGYTAAGDFAPLRHLWSLAVEEQFYLIWPIVMVLLLGRAGTRRVADVSRWLFVAAIGITLLVAIAFYSGPIGEPAQTPHAYWWLGSRPIAKLDTLYLSTFTRAGGLLLGSAFALVWRPYAVMRGPLRSKARVFDVAALLAIVCLAWMTWNIHLVTPDGASPQLFRGGLFFAGLAMIVLIAAVSHRRAFAGRLFGMRPLVWIGVRSYGLYLFHWPIFMIVRGVAGNPLTFRQFALSMIVTVAVTEASFRLVETPIRTGRFMAGWRRFRSGTSRAPRGLMIGGAATVVAVSVFAGSALAGAELKQNEIAEALGENEQFTTDLLDVDADALAADDPTPSTTVRRSGASVNASDDPRTQRTTTIPSTSLDPSSDVATETAVAIADPPGGVPVPSSSVPDGATTVPASTDPPIVEPPAPVPQLGVITDMSTVVPLVVPPTVSGVPLVALGDSVMLGAAEELAAKGFVVDAVVSRQMKTYLPDMQVIKDNGTFGPVVVVHLGTNGDFSQGTLDQMMAILADVPVVLVMTGKADRPWVAANNDKIRALPASHDNVTVLDWEVLAGGCQGTCFYGDGIHLTQSGQNYYTGLIATVLGLP